MIFAGSASLLPFLPFSLSELARTKLTVCDSHDVTSVAEHVAITSRETDDLLYAAALV